MTDQQKKAVRELINKLLPDEAHHGDCVGADFDFYVICRSLGVPSIVAHPPENDTLRAFTKSDIHRDPKPYLVRNRHIVRDSDALIAAPETATEQVRSGTWSTVRFARTVQKRIKIVLPHGDVKDGG
jgi:hypothetical protein